MAKVEGVPEVNDALGKVKDATADLTATNRTVAARILPVARGYAPVRTGQLGASLRAQGDKTGASIVSVLPYSVVQEFGSARRGILGRHYAERAIDQSLDPTTKAYADAVGDATRKAGLGWQG